jgi:cell division protein FtsQ
MERFLYNQPDTRARVDARRRHRKGQTYEPRFSPAEQAAQEEEAAQEVVHSQPLPAMQPAFEVGQAVSITPLKDRVMGGRTPSFPFPKKRSSRPTSPAARRRGQVRVSNNARQFLAAWLKNGRLVSLILFLVSITALGYLLLSSRFTIQTFAVEGNQVVSPDTIISLSQAAGTPIWFVNMADVIARIEQNPYIDHVQATVSLPNKITFSVLERRPKVRWLAGNVQYVVDSSGMVLDVADTPADPNTLTIVDNSHPFLQPEDRIDPDALRVAQDLSLRLPAEVGLTPASFGWDYGLGVYVTTQAGQTIVFGQQDDMERKLVVLRRLLADNVPFTHLDLRPDSPYFR